MREPRNCEGGTGVTDGIRAGGLVIRNLWVGPEERRSGEGRRGAGAVGEVSFNLGHRERGRG